MGSLLKYEIGLVVGTPSFSNFQIFKLGLK
ncbi:hypothetical protein BH09BAC3_BH09BAC3_28720 [soil metagenome]